MYGLSSLACSPTLAHPGAVLGATLGPLRNGLFGVLMLGACTPETAGDPASDPDGDPASVAPAPTAAAGPGDAAVAETPGPPPLPSSAVCFSDEAHEICVDLAHPKSVWLGPLGSPTHHEAFGEIRPGRRSLPHVDIHIDTPEGPRAALGPNGQLRVSCGTRRAQFRRGAGSTRAAQPAALAHPDPCVALGLLKPAEAEPAGAQR